MTKKKDRRPPYVKSNFPRVPGDHYPTVDPRCVDGFLHHFRMENEAVADICAPQGSKIIDRMKQCGIQNVLTYADAFIDSVRATWIVTNTPYELPLVDQILRRQVMRIHDGELYGYAALHRLNFDHAAHRAEMFDGCPYYFGQIKLRFRPWWSEDRTKQPIHSFVWHIWTPATHRVKALLYYTPPKPVRKRTK